MQRYCGTLINASLRLGGRRFNSSVTAASIRDALRLLPQRGGSLSELAILHRQATGISSDNATEEIRAALLLVPDEHLVVSGGDRIVPVQLRAVMTSVSSKLPPEGVLLRPFVRLLGLEFPAFLDSSLASHDGAALEAWISQRASDIISVQRARTDGRTLIFRPVGALPASSSTDAAVAALDAAAQAHVTRWIDATLIAAPWQEAVKRGLVEEDVRLVVRLRRNVVECLVVLNACDGAVDECTAKRALVSAAVAAATGPSARVHTVVLKRSGATAAGTLEQSKSTTTLTVDAFLDASDAICAHLIADTSRVQVVVCPNSSSAKTCAAAIRADCAAHHTSRRVLVYDASTEVAEVVE